MVFIIKLECHKNREISDSGCIECKLIQACKNGHKSLLPLYQYDYLSLLKHKWNIINVNINENFNDNMNENLKENINNIP